LRTLRQRVQISDRPSSHIGGGDRITTPQQRHPMLRTAGTRLVLGRHLVHAPHRETPHPRRASRQTRPNRTAIGQGTPARQVAQRWVCPSQVRYAFSPLCCRGFSLTPFTVTVPPLSWAPEQRAGAR